MAPAIHVVTVLRRCSRPRAALPAGPFPAAPAPAPSRRGQETRGRAALPPPALNTDAPCSRCGRLAIVTRAHAEGQRSEGGETLTSGWQLTTAGLGTSWQ